MTNLKKYPHSFNPYPNNISSGGKITNQLDLLMENHYEDKLNLVSYRDFYLLEQNNIKIADGNFWGLDSLRKYLVEMQDFLEEVEDIPLEEQSPREQMITKGFYHLLALYDVMNRVEIINKKIIHKT